MEKILFYSASLYRGGAQRVLSVIMNSLSSEYDVGFITDITPNGKREEYTLGPNIRRYYLSDTEVVTPNIKRIRRLRKIIRLEKPDAVVSFLGPPNIRNILAGAWLKVKTIVSVRNDPYREYGSGLKKAVANLLFRNVDCCVFQTEEAREYFRCLPEKKAVIIANPVDERFYRSGWLGDSRSICVIGRLEKQKDPELAMTAFQEVLRKHPAYSLHYYGTGSLSETLKSECERRGLTDSVFFHGEVSNIEDVLTHAFAYILCSAYEGMPNALMEAMAVGCPVISTDCPCGGPRFLIEHNVNGLMIPCGDAAQLAGALCSVIEDHRLRSKLANNARLSAERFRTEQIVSEWKQILLSPLK